MGRKKEILKGKQSGGNEFITAYIEKHTGVLRSRKQVSSHIQVLKAFLGDNHECWYPQLEHSSHKADLYRAEPRQS